MWVCKECFADEELRQFVDESSGDGVCDACGTRGTIIELAEIIDFLDSVLRLFMLEGKRGKTLPEYLTDEWKIFSDRMVAKTILDEILKTTSYGFGIDDSVVYTDDIQDRIGVWERLKKDVRENYRFFVDHDRFDEYAGISPSYTLRKGTLLYRARINPAGIRKLEKNAMGCPPANLATPGRANPLGIPYLYLSREEETTYYEVRSAYLDSLSLGKFEIIRDLEIVDFNSEVSLYLAYTASIPLENIVVKKKIMNAISLDLSRPMRRYDTELEYIPTQLICEYCKRNNADGICFDSSLNNGGLNYVLFNPSDAVCVDVEAKEIKSVQIDVW